MPRLAHVIPILAIFVWSSMAYAEGVTDGEIFGYKLGDRYKVGPDTQGSMHLGRVIILADRKEVPAELPQLEVVVTPKTFTIGNIYAKAYWGNNKAAAQEQAERYKELLTNKYAGRCATPKKTILDFEILRMACGPYQLRVSLYAPDKERKEGGYSVQIGLQLRDDTEQGKRWNAMFMAELKSLEKEGQKSRLEEAQKNQSLRGIN